MSAFEQKREIPNRALQYMVVCLFCLLLPHSLLAVSFLVPPSTELFGTRRREEARNEIAIEVQV